MSRKDEPSGQQGPEDTSFAGRLRRIEEGQRAERRRLHEESQQRAARELVEQQAREMLVRVQREAELTFQDELLSMMHAQSILEELNRVRYHGRMKVSRIKEEFYYEEQHWSGDSFNGTSIHHVHKNGFSLSEKKGGGGDFFIGFFSEHEVEMSNTASTLNKKLIGFEHDTFRVTLTTRVPPYFEPKTTGYERRLPHEYGAWPLRQPGIWPLSQQSRETGVRGMVLLSLAMNSTAKDTLVTLAPRYTPR